MKNNAHLGGKLSLSVKGVQVADHNVGGFLQRYRLGRLINWLQGPLLHVGVKGHPSAVAVCGTAALRWRRILDVRLHVICLLDIFSSYLFVFSYFNNLTLTLPRQIEFRIIQASRGNRCLPLIVRMLELLLLVGFVCERENNIRDERRRLFHLLLMLVQQLLTLWWTQTLRVCLEPAPSPVCVFYVFRLLPYPH